MKNLQAISSKADIHDFVMGLWKTDMFRDSHRDGGFVYKVVEEFAWLPRLFAHTSNDHLERAHFSTWWNVLMIRDDYVNPYIHDLYWIHEFYHAGHMPYVPGIGRAAFEEKMQRNELEASVFSEIQAYFALPGLRKASFNHPIYADRFLQDQKMEVLWRSNPAVCVEKLRTIRRDVMISKPDSLMDDSERWIRRFADQNTVYGNIWASRYHEVEERMAALQYESTTRSRKYAIQAHVDWLTEESERDAIYSVPFKSEAEQFAVVYWANKRLYAEALKSQVIL